MPLPRLSLLAAQAVLALAALAGAGAATAARSDNNQPTTVDADALRYDDLNQTTIFSGNVVLTKGTLILRADKLELREDPEGYQSGVATAAGGKLVNVRQRREGTDEYIEGVAERVEYDGRGELIHFISRAVVKRLACEQLVDEVRGQKVTYNQRTETYSASGGPQAPTSNQRVRTVIQPRGQATGEAPAAGGCPPAPQKAQQP